MRIIVLLLLNLLLTLHAEVLIKEVKETYEGGIPKIVEFSDQGKNVVQQIAYFQNGTKEHEINIKAKGENGELEVWSEDRKLILKASWKDYGLDWDLTGYHPNGQLHYKGGWSGEKPHGNWKTYFPDGQKEFSGTIFMGKPEGVQELFWPNGQLRGRCNYTNGIENGKLKMWFETGEIHIVRTYDYGKFTAQKRYNKKGQLTSDVEFTEKEAISGQSFYLLWPMKTMESAKKYLDYAKPFMIRKKN